MRTLLDTEEEEERKPSEITLSTASLLGIFFGLVLVCGVFFGFGYSMGRGSEAHITMPVSPAPDPAETVAAQNTPPPAQPEPQVEEKAPVKTSAPAADTADAEDVPPAPAPRPTLKKPSAVQEAALQSQAVVAQAPTAAAAPATSQPMVQIAAVARREDADVLVAALRQRGYGVVVRSEPQDKFFHVQVGPFADRVQATAIKQKLLSDGYNAIIKQ
jgi:cell division protein FtsN